ncbi:unnamed protein product [Pseudo-nitzschia multistriata]|uniref:(S)-ureidoglycine aminohydrolase cupin domain-containing protein n=1 Tax=Pseudo-nitzschia multistriata TaxID=183589 RepID=A0A448YVN1_9STRA|nr:unnamed protein product [Pseudo-nitzschia multistriata]
MIVRSFALSSVALLLAGYSSAFQQHQVRTGASSSRLAFSYLDDLSGDESAPLAANTERSDWGYWPGPGASVPAAPVPAAPKVVGSAGGGSENIHHAPIEYFSIDQMVSKGPRATKDWGTPQDATRKLADDGTLRAGSWFCSEGGWPSPNQKAHTEVFFVLEGHGMLGDSDGTKHYFGPGDTVIIPKGHTGRWDVYSPIHKIWAVNAHDYIEEDQSVPIRVRVDGYHTFAPHFLTPNGYGIDPLYAASAPEISYKTFYDVGPTSVGVWASERAFIPIPNPLERKVFFHLLEGALNVHDISTGGSQRCLPGDTIMLPQGFKGYIDVLEPAKKMFTTAL